MRFNKGVALHPVSRMADVKGGQLGIDRGPRQGLNLLDLLRGEEEGLRLDAVCLGKCHL